MEIDELRDKVREVADLAIKYARDINAPSAEAFVYNQKVTRLSDNNGKIDSRLGLVQGVGIRVAHGKKVGFSSCTGFDPEPIKEAIKQANSIAKVSPENPMFNGFTPDSKESKDGIIDTEIMNLDAIKLAEFIDGISNEIDRNDQRIVSTSISVNNSWRGYAIATTEGCLTSSLLTTLTGFCETVVTAANDRRTGDHSVVGRKIPNFEGLGATATKKALDGLGAKPFEGSEVLPTIWESRHASSFLGFAFGGLFSGSAFVEKQNPWMDKLDQQVAVSNLNVVDDGESPEFFNTSAVDTEGIPKRKTVTIENGVLKSFLFDRMYGEAAGKETTGNAVRFAQIPFEGGIGIAPSKIVIETGNLDLEKQIAEVDKGILISGAPIGLFTANQATGDFSVTCNQTFLIEKGEIVYPLKSIGLAGNYFKTFNDIVHIGSDRELTGQTTMSPSMTFNNHTISG